MNYKFESPDLEKRYNEVTAKIIELREELSVLIDLDARCQEDALLVTQK